MPRWLAGVAICLLVTSCARGSGGGATTTPDGQQRSMIAATPLPGGELVTGILAADTVEGSCPHLHAADGTRYEVLWPEGWSLDRFTLELTDPEGVIVARAGDEVSVRGSPASDVASTCQIGPMFRASEVVLP